MQQFLFFKSCLFTSEWLHSASSFLISISSEKGEKLSPVDYAIRSPGMCKNKQSILFFPFPCIISTCLSTFALIQGMGHASHTFLPKCLPLLPPMCTVFYWFHTGRHWSAMHEHKMQATHTVSDSVSFWYSSTDRNNFYTINLTCGETL